MGWTYNRFTVTEKCIACTLLLCFFPDALRGCVVKQEEDCVESWTREPICDVKCDSSDSDEPTAGLSHEADSQVGPI